MIQLRYRNTLPGWMFRWRCMLHSVQLGTDEPLLDKWTPFLTSMVYTLGQWVRRSAKDIMSRLHIRCTVITCTELIWPDFPTRWSPMSQLNAEQIKLSRSLIMFCTISWLRRPHILLRLLFHNINHPSISSPHSEIMLFSSLTSRNPGYDEPVFQGDPWSN